MASFVTYIGDKQILIEAPVASAFAKSDSEIPADPKRAISSIFEHLRLIVEFAGEQLGPTVRKTGAAFELSFAARTDSFGLVMISEQANLGQFQVTVKWPPTRPAGAPPPGPRPVAALPGPDDIA